MVLLVLYVKAELENIGSIKFPANLQYCLDVKDAQSDEEKKGVYMCADEIAEIDGSKGDANFVMRFPDCKKQCTVTFTDVKGVTREEYTEEDSGTFVPIRAFDCRGLELTNWTPNGGLIARSKEGTVWEDVDLGAPPVVLRIVLTIGASAFFDHLLRPGRRWSKKAEEAFCGAD